MTVKNSDEKKEADKDLHAALVGSLRDLNVVFEDLKGIKLKGGAVSKYYVDVKKAYGYPHELRLIADAMWAEMDHDTTCIVASGYGGVPLATVIAAKHKLKLVLLEEQYDSLAEYKIPTQEALVRMKSELEPGVTCIAAAGHQSLIAATLLSVEYDLKLTMIREEIKNHGKPTKLDGYIPEVERVQLVHSGLLETEEIRKQAEALEKNGGALVVYRKEKGWQRFATMLRLKQFEKNRGIEISVSEYGPEPVGEMELASEKAAIVDDVTTTGGSLIEMKRHAEPHGAQVLGCYVVVKRGENDVGTALTYLTTPEELLLN